MVTSTGAFNKRGYRIGSAAAGGGPALPSDLFYKRTAKDEAHRRLESVGNESEVVRHPT
jgi:hypothetical protein